MSTINTNGINVNYPVPGVNNSSQGFRDNFASIKNNLNVASTELSDLQNKVVVKSALDNTVVNNDMANTLISNASTKNFRLTTYNLGNALSGTVVIDTSLGDVHFGTVTANTTLQFSNWAPAGTERGIELQLNISNANAVISFPTEVISSNNNFGVTVLENYANIASVATVTAPANVSQLNYKLTTVNCGNSIYIEPLNRPQQSTQIQQRTPSPKGYLGDVVGTTCVDPGTTQLTITNTYANDEILTSSTTSLYKDMPVVFTGTTFGGVTAGTTYYVATVPSSTNFTIATTVGGGNVDLSAVSGNMYLNPVQYMYVAVQDYDSTTYTKTVSQTVPTITLSGVTITGIAGQFSCTTSSRPLVIGQTVVISGTFGGTGSISGYSNPTTYYIIATDGSTTFTLSTSAGGSGVTTTAGAPTGLTYTVNTNIAVLNNTTSLTVNSPVIFTGETDVANTNIISGEVYYVKTIPNGTTITISRSRTNGVADSVVTLGAWTAGTTFSATSYIGSDIWKRISLNSW